MRGITVASDLFLLIMMIGFTVFLTLFIWAFIFMFEVESALNVATPRNVELRLFFIIVIL